MSTGYQIFFLKNVLFKLQKNKSGVLDSADFIEDDLRADYGTIETPLLPQGI